MYQLKYNDNFTITRDIPYLKELPKNIKDEITEISNKRTVFDKSRNKLLCGKCGSVLNKDYYCENCSLNHKKYDKYNINYINYLKDIRNYFFYFLEDNNIYLYCVIESLSYNDSKIFYPIKSASLDIDLDKSYLVEKDGLTNLKTHEFTSYDELGKMIEEDYLFEEDDDKSFRIYDELFLDETYAYLLTSSLDTLKQTIYKYSKIWLLKNFLEKEDSFTISQFTIFPLYYESFEYLINYQLYNLAWHIPYEFKKKGNFKEMFGLEKKYLSFMVEESINYEEYHILKYFPTTNKKVLNYFKNYSYEFYNLPKLNLKKIMNYFLTNNLASHQLNEYFDYIRMNLELNIELNKEVLFPKDFREAHINILNNIETVYDEEKDNKIKTIAKVLDINKYEDECLIIYPAPSIASLIEESYMQKNCVRTYIDKIVEGKCQIYFMRKKKDLNNSFVTIEVRENKVVQYRIKYNNLPDNGTIKIIKKWEESLLPIDIN